MLKNTKLENLVFWFCLRLDILGFNLFVPQTEGSPETNKVPSSCSFLRKKGEINWICLGNDEHLTGWERELNLLKNKYRNS